VSPDMLVNSQQIVAAPAGLAVEHLGLQGKAGKIAGEGVGRASPQAETEVRDVTVGTVAAPQILLGPRLQVVQAVALAAVLDRHTDADRRIRFHVDQGGGGSGAPRSGAMRRLTV